LNAAGSALAYSTYIGGSNEDAGFAIAVDQSLNAYVTGYTCSADFPILNAFQETKHAYCDAFVAKLNAGGSALGYSTYLGGSTPSVGYGIAVDSFRNAYVTGYTSAPDFPATADAFQSSYAGPSCCDAYVTKLTSTGSALVYSSYLGGSREDVGYGIAVDSSANAYVTGYTCSRDFPTTSVAFQTSNASWGCYDAFVTRIADEISSTAGKVNGTGFIRPRYLSLGFGDKASFAFSVQFNVDKAKPTGNLTYDDGSVGVRIKALSIKFMSIGDGPCGANAHARFAGLANVTGSSGEPVIQDFEVNVGDCGEPGSSSATEPDRFSIATSGAIPYTAVGFVEGGNIQVRGN
jgi:Beta-propeller repeat